MAQCTITGSVKDLLGNAVTDAVISASVVTPFFDSDANLISGQIASATTDSSGNFSLSVLQTTALGKLITFTFNYSVGSGQRRDKKYNLFVPDTTTALFSDMVAQVNVPSSTSFFPAANVTVTPFPGIASTNVQAALVELEDQINSVDVDLTGPISATAGVTSITAQTGTGTTFVVDTAPTIQSPTLVAPALGTPVSGVATNLSGTATALSIGGNAATATLAAGVTTNANLTGPITSVGNATSIASQTGTGTKFVVDTSPTLVTPDLGVATATSINSTSIPSSKTLVVTTDKLSALAATTSAELKTVISDETGTGSLVFADSPTLINPALGTPASGVATNLTGTATALNIGGNAATATLASTVTTNANLTGDVTSVGNATTLTNAPVIAKVLTGYTSGAGTISASDSILSAIQKLNGNDATNANLTGVITSVGNATSIASQTGTGTKFVVDTSPTLVTPVIGVATGTSLSVSGQLASTVATGTAPLAVSSTTRVANLNAATAGNADTVTTNANLTGGVTSVGNAATVVTNANLTGEATSVGNAVTLTNSAVIGKVLTGYTSGAGTVAATDTILQAIQKLNGNAGTASPLTTKGDIYTYSTLSARQAVPGDYGSIVPDSGTTTGWRSANYLRSVDNRLKNYIQYCDFENNATTGWTGTGCATITNGLPVTVGSGAAAFSSSNGGRGVDAHTNDPSIDSTSAVSGTYALKLATTGAGVAGDGYISSAYTIDPSDRAKVLSYKLNYKITVGTPVLSGTSSNTYAVAIYDVANNAWLPVAGAFNFVQSSGVGIAQGTFQTASTTTSLQIFVYLPVGTVGSSTILIDDVYVGPQALAFGPAMSDWTAYTPTWSAGFGTVTNSLGYWKRVGDSLEVYASGTLGTRVSTIASISIPSGLTIDSAKVSINNTTSNPGSLVGTYRNAEAAANVGGNLVTAPSTSASLVYFANSDVAAASHLTPSTVDQVSISSTVMSVFFTVPISGWSSNTVMSADSDTREVTFQAKGYSSGTVGANFAGSTAIVWGTVERDSHAAYSAGTYTVPVTGTYRFSGMVSFSGTEANDGAAVISISVAGTQTRDFISRVMNTGLSSVYSFITCELYLTAGQAIQWRPWVVSYTGAAVQNSNTETFVNLSRISGPAVVAASESVNARYYASATSLSGSLATISWTTKDFDTHSGMSSGTYTVPVSGKYQVNSFLAISGTFALNNVSVMEIQKNGSVYSRYKNYAGAAVTQLDVGIGDIVNCVAGDTIRIQVSNNGTGAAIVSSNFENWMSISRIGN